ncbi:MAG TPA: hypothetical protein VIP70_01255 [Nitrososphaeraceae archaeon]|jgi:hypothetical protein
MVLENISLVQLTLVIIASLVLGTITGFVLYKYLKRRNALGLTQHDHASIKITSTVKEELQSLEFERSLVSAAITRVYEATMQGQISKAEYNRLMLQYKERLRSYTDKIAELRTRSSFLEIQDLRNDLVYILEKRIKQIDDKLFHLSKSSGSPGSESTYAYYRGSSENEYKQPQISVDDIDYSKKRSVDIEQERKIRELQQEIMLALNRLEDAKIDEKHPDSETPITKKKDALASLR